MRQQEWIERINNIFRSGRKLPFIIGGGIVIIFLLGYALISIFAPFVPALPVETPDLSSDTSTEIPPTTTFILGVGSR